MSHARVRQAAAPAAALLALLTWGQAHTGARQTPPRVNEDAQLIAAFSKRIEAYVELHRKSESTLPARPDKPTSQQLDTHERALARLIAQGRARAQPGDIFSKDIRAYFRRQIARTLSGPDGAQIRGSIMDENPGRIQIRINSRYPDEIPVSTMPPQILAALPKLPDELEYRFIGERLILLDIHAHLIVDFIEDALPR
jgi:hypothetical protein